MFWIILVLYFIVENKGEMGENKTGANIILYIVYSYGIDYFNNYFICDK